MPNTRRKFITGAGAVAAAGTAQAQDKPQKKVHYKGKPPAKTPLFKSRKELILLGVVAVIFAGVIYKMYLSKPSNAAAETRAVSCEPGAAFSMSRTMAERACTGEAACLTVSGPRVMAGATPCTAGRLRLGVSDRLGRGERV